MVTNPGDYVEEFAKIGVEYFTFHQETVPHMHRLIQHIKQCGMKAGVALNPSTPVSLLEDVSCRFRYDFNYVCESRIWRTIFY